MRLERSLSKNLEVAVFKCVLLLFLVKSQVEPSKEKSILNSRQVEPESCGHLPWCSQSAFKSSPLGVLMEELGIFFLSKTTEPWRAGWN